MDLQRTDWYYCGIAGRICDYDDRAVSYAEYTGSIYDIIVANILLRVAYSASEYFENVTLRYVVKIASVSSWNETERDQCLTFNKTVRWYCSSDFCVKQQSQLLK